MKRTNGQRLHRPAASCTDVYDSSVGPEVNTPSSSAQTPAQVGIFPIEEVPLVEAADLIEGLPSNQDARAADPVDGRGGLAFRQSPGKQHIAARHLRGWKQARQERGSTEEPGHHRRVAPGIPLGRAVLVDDAGSDRGATWVRFDFVEQRLEEPWSHEAIGVDEQQTVRSCYSRAQVRAGSETGVGFETEQPDSGYPLALLRHRRTVICRRIVDNHNFPVEPGKSASERSEALAQVRAAVVVDDDDGDVGCHCSRPRSTVAGPRKKALAEQELRA